MTSEVIRLSGLIGPKVLVHDLDTSEPVPKFASIPDASKTAHTDPSVSKSVETQEFKPPVSKF